MILITALHEKHRGLDQRVGEGADLAGTVDGGDGAIGHQGQTQAGRLQHGSWNVRERLSDGRGVCVITHSAYARPRLCSQCPGQPGQAQSQSDF